MTLKELLETTSWEEVATRLATSYPSQKESLPGYKRVYAVLLEKEPAASNMIITLEPVADADEKGGSYESVFGKIEGLGQPFCLSITPWSEWLGMSIDPETIRKYTPEEIAAHCLYEMTFHGFTEEKIQGFAKKLEESIDEEGKEFVELSDLFDDQ